MIVRNLQQIIGTERDVNGPVWASRRFLLAEDGVGFTVTETTVEAGSEQVLWYKHHVEANYVVAGEGEVENVATGEVYPLAPGSIYVLDQHEKHRARGGRGAGALRVCCRARTAAVSAWRTGGSCGRRRRR